MLDSLKHHLMFPLPKSDELKAQHDPVIPITHPLYDYYNDANWGGVVSNRAVNKVVIFPSSITAEHGGLFSPITAESFMKNAADAWTNDILPTDEPREVIQKLDDFVKEISVSYARQASGLDEFNITSKDVPGGFDVFPTNSDGSTSMTKLSATRMQKSTDAYKKLSKYNEKQDVLFNSLRVYYAYNYIESLFDKDAYDDKSFDPDDYFFVKRLLLMTKMLFVANLLMLSDNDVLFDQILGWMYNNGVQYTTVDPEVDSRKPVMVNGKKVIPKTFHLDDMFTENVELSHAVKKNSEELLRRKHEVGSARDNFESISNADRLALLQKRNSKILFYVVLALLCLQILSIVITLMTGNYMLALVIMLVTSFMVLGIKLTKTLNVLIFMSPGI